MKAQVIKQRLFGLGVFLALTAVPTFAHHPFAPEFDWKKPVTLTGTVTKVEWTNPHALVSIDVRDASGTITTWALEFGSPTVLEKYYRWKGNLPKTGDKVAVDGWLAADGRKLVSAKSFHVGRRPRTLYGIGVLRPSGEVHQRRGLHRRRRRIHHRESVVRRETEALSLPTRSV